MFQEDDLVKLQQLSNLQPLMTSTHGSCNPTNSSNHNTIGMIEKTVLNFIFIKCVYKCLIY